MLAIARERSKQLERERRNKLQEARRNQEEAEKRLKARKLAEHKRQHYQGKQYDSNDKKAERRGVRDLDEWEIKQKQSKTLLLSVGSARPLHSKGEKKLRKSAWQN